MKISKNKLIMIKDKDYETDSIKIDSILSA